LYRFCCLLPDWCVLVWFVVVFWLVGVGVDGGSGRFDLSFVFLAVSLDLAFDCFFGVFFLSLWVVCCFMFAVVLVVWCGCIVLCDKSVGICGVLVVIVAGYMALFCGRGVLFDFV